MRAFHLIVGLVLFGTGCFTVRSGDEDSRGGWFGWGGAENHAPVVDSVEIRPDSVYVDGPATCVASASDPDGDEPSLSYTWQNVTSGQTLGTGPDIDLSPGLVMPGETLECVVVAHDAEGDKAQAAASVEPVCGFWDVDSLLAVNFELEIFFRPYITEELRPGYGGEPWDWDGDVPDWLFEFADLLETILDTINMFYPDPTLLAAAEALDAAQQIASLIDQYAPELLEDDVPPDPDLYPYRIDADGYVDTYWDESKGGMQWSNTYEVGIEAEDQDLYNYQGFAVDMEDIDLLYDDNMGDYLDQDDMPLILYWPLFYDGAYCSSVYFNPTEYAQDSEVAYLPSSILYLRLDVW